MTACYNVATLWPMPKTNRRRVRSSAKPGKLRKDEDVRFRATAEEKAALQAAADKAGLGLSAWLRQLALQKAGALPGEL